MVGAEVVLGFDRCQKGCDSLELEGSGQVEDAVWGVMVASSGLLFSNSTGRWVMDQRERDAALSCGVLGLDREVQGLQGDRTFRSVGTDSRSYHRDQGEALESRGRNNLEILRPRPSIISRLGHANTPACGPVTR